jgi:hypothetical protein
MTKAVLATFSDARPIKTRSVLQLVFEVPIDRADEAMKFLGGFPQPAEERWVGIALALKEREKIEAPAKERKPFHELRASAQAGIRCGEPEFWKYLEETVEYACSDSDGAADVVRKICKVQSRSEFDVNGIARQRWNLMESGYQAYLTTQKYSEVMR